MAMVGAKRDAAETSFHAHTLKSSARTVGTEVLADLCLTLEMAGKEADWAVIDMVSADLEPEMVRVSEYVAAL